MTNNNILFFIPSPRDIDIVRQRIEEIIYPRYDVLWVKYFNELDAYKIGRKIFLGLCDIYNYDYFCIIPDDLVLNQKSFDLLIDELNKRYRYEVLSGICNVSNHNWDMWNSATAVFSPMPTRDPLYYNWINFDDVSPPEVKRVIFAGFPVTFISKGVMKSINFLKRNPKNSLDLELARHLEEWSIPQYVHFGARFLHLGGPPNPYEFMALAEQRLPEAQEFFVGVKPPEIKLHSALLTNILVDCIHDHNE